MIEDQNSAEDEDNLFTIFSVFDPEHNGFVEGKNIKKSLLCLDDVPAEELDEILEKAGITDDRKLTMEGKIFNYEPFNSQDQIFNSPLKMLHISL